MAVKTILTSDEIMSMIGAAQCQRDQVIMQFYAETGCRESELLNIRVQDIDFEKREVLIRHLKRGAKKHCPACGHTAGRSTQFCARCGESLEKVAAEGLLNRYRIITISDELANLLADFTMGMDKSEQIIKLSRQGVYNIIRKLAERAGLSGKLIQNPESGRKHYVHPHILRSSLAVDWLAMAGSDANKQKALQEHLGHQDFSTTMRYNKLSSTQVRKVVDEVRSLRFKKVA